MGNVFDIIPVNRAKKIFDGHVIAICLAFISHKEFYPDSQYFTVDGGITRSGSDNDVFPHTYQEFEKAMEVLREKGYHMFYDGGPCGNPSYHLHLTQDEMLYPKGRWLF